MMKTINRLSYLISLGFSYLFISASKLKLKIFVFLIVFK